MNFVVFFRKQQYYLKAIHEKLSQLNHIRKTENNNCDDTENESVAHVSAPSEKEIMVVSSTQFFQALMITEDIKKVSREGLGFGSYGLLLC